MAIGVVCRWRAWR